MNDVTINYYPKSAKGHDLGRIAFNGGIGELLDTDRVDVDVTTNTMYFRKATGKKGLKLAANKVQLWATAHQLQGWEGEYPLIYDQHAECYCVHRMDAQPVEPMPSRLSLQVQQPKRVVEKKESEIDESIAVGRIRKAVLEAESDKKMDKFEKALYKEPKVAKPVEEVKQDKRNIYINNKSNDTYKRKQTTEIYLKNKVLELTIAGRLDESQILAKAYQIISQESE